MIVHGLIMSAGDLPALVASDVNAPSAESIRTKLAEAAFGKSVIQNDLRGIVSEIIIGLALGPEWKWCSGNWSGWDFEHTSNCRLEIKQSAALQSWAAPNKSSPARFDIKARTGYYLGAEWVAEAGRHAQIYVFAHHPVTDSSADHCDPRQWQFHVVATTQLPPSKSISLKAVSALAPAVSWNGLRDAVEEVRRSCGF